jgi:hypothetical protein
MVTNLLFTERSDTSQRFAGTKRKILPTAL